MLKGPMICSVIETKITATASEYGVDLVWVMIYSNGFVFNLMSSFCFVPYST